MFKDFLNLLFPKWCAGCMETLIAGEELVCTSCRSELVISLSYRERPNEISAKFFGKLPVEHAFTMFNFSKGGVTQNLLYRLKYEGYYELGLWLGSVMGTEIKNEEWVSGLDFIVPIPLHKKKLKARGYNQSESFSRGLSEVIDKPVSEILDRTRYTETQTRKSRLDRWNNVSGIFQMKEEIDLSGKTILLIDDVVTSGATLEAAGNILLSKGAKQLYLATIASA